MEEEDKTVISGSKTVLRNSKDCCQMIVNFSPVTEEKCGRGSTL